MTVVWRRPVTYLAVIVAVLVVWILLTATGAVKPILLASPVDVWARLVFLAKTPIAIFQPIAVTLGEVGVAFVIAAVLAIPVGVITGSSELLRQAYTPLLTTLNALPLVILYPVLAATLGIGSESKVALGALYGFFPIAIATAQAAAQVDRRLLIASEVMGASRGQRIQSVTLPAIAGPIVSGMRVSLALTLVTIIAGEFIS
ncbi:MAG: ABC transporter permease subunit, partial [Actinomycetota bacterium]|nr:ABC transporter permease subunit [Actinomycetota bacterium]